MSSDPNLTTTTLLALNRLKEIRHAAPHPLAPVTSVRAASAAKPRPRRRGLLATVVAVGLAVGSVAAAAVMHGGGESSAHSSDAHEPALRRVHVVSPQRVAGGNLILPATLRAYQATDLYARISGYVRVWHVDLGDTVAAGQLLAEIDTPELDQELAQADAQYKQSQAAVAEAIAERHEAVSQIELAAANIQRAEAQLKLAQTTYNRNKPLAAKEAISQQELDESAAVLDSRAAEIVAAKADHARQKAMLETRDATVIARQALVASHAANVERLRELQGFRRIVAPFAGVITRRNVEVGMLVSPGSVGQTALFSIAEQDRLRVTVAIPQAQSSVIAEGQEASVSVPEHPGRTFSGVITRTAEAVDVASRTLTVEVELDNADDVLLPGAYGEVTFSTHRQGTSLRIPAGALLLKPQGTFVAAVSADERVKVIKVTLGRDFGSEVAVVAGLSGDEQLIVNPADDLTDGEQVALGAAGA